MAPETVMYILKHKDDVVAIVDFHDAQASQIDVKEVVDAHLLPICAQSDISKLDHWWRRRSVPASRPLIRRMLQDGTIPSTNRFLLDNLALSVTDCYWLCPEGSALGWADVSFHGNSFKEDLDFSHRPNSMGSAAVSSFTPSASLGGDLDKKWIRRTGRIFLVKGNMPGNSFQQSLNEVFASSVHRMQGFGNHVDYELVKMKNGMTGCLAACFTSDEIEFVPAWEIFDKYGYGKNGSYLDQYVTHCADEGVDRAVARRFVDYQFMTDFIMTNTDRHLANFGLLRNSSTLECTAPAPIFDTGNSMFYDGAAAVTFHTLLDVRIQSLYTSERTTVEKLDADVVDLDALPSADGVRDFYMRDPSLVAYAQRIADCFEFKKAMAGLLQEGRSFGQVCKQVSAFYAGLGPRDRERLDLFPSSRSGS